MKRKAKAQKIDRAVVENAMLDTMRLRAALLLACTELTDGDPLEGWLLAEEFYDEAPKLIALLAEPEQKLPAAPATVIPFPTKER